MEKVDASYRKHTLKFTFNAGTSRGILQEKDSYFLILRSKEAFGIGEAGPLFGLSAEFTTIESEIQELCNALNRHQLLPKLSSSLQTAYEMAQLGLKKGSFEHLFSPSFLSGKKRLPINGLIWMGDKNFMHEQIKTKLKEGFTTLKMKIGAIGVQNELEILHSLRKEYASSELELRVDANGAFSLQEAKEILKKLFELEVHSIEQPIAKGQWDSMAELCQTSPMAVALDEELIGVNNRKELLEYIKPTYIILKPSLHGGFHSCAKWIKEVQNLGISWWITSALESNIGLNAIAQFVEPYGNDLPQGLGTGQLYANNINSPLFIKNGFIGYDPTKKWDLSQPVNFFS